MSKPIKNNSQLLYLQARQLFERAQVKFEDGTIKTEPKLVEAVFNSFQEFFTSMGKPNMVPRYAPEQGPPWSADYNHMMTEVRQDLELLFQELDILGRSLYTDFNHNMIQHEIINKQFEDVLDKIRDLESYAGIGGMNIQIGRDDFLNKDKVDYARITGTPLEIVDGAVTLPQTSRTNVAENAKITIIAGNRQGNKFILGTESNGFPGNNTEIHSVTDDILTNNNYIPTFLGEENNHSDYSVVLDGSPNTWFEYEKVNVREHDKVRVAKNLGWDYQVHENQTIAWAEDPDGGVLKLHMQIVLDKESIINQINCNMYTPPNYGAKTAIVKNILISDGKGAPISVVPKNKTDDQYHFHFPPVNAKVISVLLEQPNKYITDIGHIFYEKKMQTEDNAEYAMDMATKKYKYAPRVEGPLIALEDLGIDVKVSESNVEANYPLLQSNGDSQASIGETINRLMNSVDVETVDMGVEKFEGFRWCIGIRDVEIYSCEYATEGELVTRPFYFDKPLDKISLNASENLPSAFTTTDALKYNWIKYFVSIDDGAVWHPITPMNQEILSDDQPPKIYTVRMIESAEQHLEGKRAYIESEYPVYSMRLKIIARRPEDYTTEGFTLKDQSTVTSFVQSSPIVNAYMFNIQTIDDVVSSEESNRMIAEVENISDKPDTGYNPNNPNDPTIPDDNGGMPPGTGGDNPWDDDDGDGIPNWDDPNHNDYVPPSDRPPTGWKPPGNPGTYPDYPPSGGGSNNGGGNTGGRPNEDDDNDGTPNEDDPDWKPELTVTMNCKRTEWCIDQPLVFKGQVYSSNLLSKVELSINNEVKETQTLTGNVATYEFTIPANTYTAIPLTVVVKGYDSKGSAVDTDVLNMVNCEGLPPEDQPQDCKDTNQLNVVIDRKVSELCICDPILYYGTVQSPNPIQSIVFRVNGNAFDPMNLGTPPANDPCGATTLSIQSVSVKQASDESLLEIEDFGEWLDAFETKNDCGCKKKKVTPQFQMQSTPFEMMAVDERSFRVELPYWKLRELGAKAGQVTKIEVTAIDSLNQEAKDQFDVMIQDCNKPPTDEKGNPRVRECWQLESVEIQYYDHNTKQIESKVIPANAIPFESISNGAGSEVTVGWRQSFKAPIIMQTSGYDDSGYTFQIHAVGVHYLNEYDQPNVTWSAMAAEKTATVKNVEKMLGDANRDSSWVTDMEELGDYSTSPSLGKINDYVTFAMSNEWITKACPVTIPNFEITENKQPEEPQPDEPCQEISNCNTLTHILFQLYDEASQQLKMYKVDVSATGKDTYNVVTKNGNVTLTVGWVNYFKGPSIQIKSGGGADNILLTAMGVAYKNKCGESDTTWATQVRYKTNGVHYPDFVVGGKKELADIGWISNGVVDYAQATYIGRQGDMVAYVVDETFTNEMCTPEKPIDEEVGIDPNNPPDVPRIDFPNAPTKMCIEEDTLLVNGVASDDVGLKEITYGVAINNVNAVGPFTNQVSGLENTTNFSINASQVSVGDFIRFHITAKNIFGVTAMKYLDILVESCDAEAPVVTLATTLTANNGKYCYSDLVNGNAPMTIRVTDDLQVGNWTVTSGTWSQTEQYLIGVDETNDTGLIGLSVPVTIPAAQTDSYGRSFTPDSTLTVNATATDKSGKQGAQALTITLTDCAYDPTPPTPPIPEVSCGESTQGGNGPATNYYVLGSKAGTVTVSYDFYGAEDKMDIYYKDVLLYSTGNRTMNGIFTFPYNPDADETKVKIVMNDGQTGSAWVYTVGCPV